MIRRPRFPLTVRLGWIERELAAAAKLLPALIRDLRELRARGDEADGRVAILAGLVGASLLLHGLNPVTLKAFVEAMGPEDDVDEAEELSADLMEQVFALLADDEGKPN